MKRACGTPVRGLYHPGAAGRKRDEIRVHIAGARREPVLNVAGVVDIVQQLANKRCRTHMETRLRAVMVIRTNKEIAFVTRITYSASREALQQG
ncbi:MAG: hypothetical protein ABT11_10130 [Novosphingobium sp. SCN 66-18]|nr:MAG: hypothetical protein ABT11_10130 [Novosphingobium sp. SCN 66-18]